MLTLLQYGQGWYQTTDPMEYVGAPLDVGYEEEARQDGQVPA